MNILTAACRPSSVVWKSAFRRPLSVIGLLALGASLFATSVQAEETPSALPEIDHMVYLSFLPEADQLMADAKTSGLTILRLDKTADKVVVTYKYPEGHTATLGYALLSAARSSDRVIGRDDPVVETRTTTVIEREPEVVYVERPRTRVVYRDYDPFWAPLTIGLGIGYLSGHNHHHYSYYPRYHYPRYRYDYSPRYHGGTRYHGGGHRSYNHRGGDRRGDGRGRR